MKFLNIFSLLTWLTVSGLVATPQKVITYNIRQDTLSDKGVRDWQQRLPNVVKFLEVTKASVVGLQEVRVNQLNDLLKALPHYASVGVGREDGISRGEYSPIFYDTSIWELDKKDTGTFWLSDTPKVPNSKTWGNNYTRICTWVRLRGKKGSGLEGRGLYVYNTHWDHRSSKSREKSALLIIKKIQQRKHVVDSFIVMGDFNATTDQIEVKTFLKDDFLIDYGVKQFKTSTKWKAEIKKGLRIDHIFISPNLGNSDVKAGLKTEVKVVATGDPPASDHHPVVMTIDFGAKDKLSK